MYDKVVVPQLFQIRHRIGQSVGAPYGNGLTGMGGGYLTDSATVVGMVIPYSQKAWCPGFAGYNDVVHII